MIANKINTGSSAKIELKTHTFYYEQIGKYLAGYIVINNSIYNEMVLSSRIYVGNDSIQGYNMNLLRDIIVQQLHVYPNPEFVFKLTPIENERYLMYRFLKSIFLGDEQNIYLFSNEEEYKNFCYANDFENTEQEWFKRFYVDAEYNTAITYITQKSLEFQELYFPDNSRYSRSMPSLHDAQVREHVKNFKSDFSEIYDILKMNNITRLFHFTDKKNIASILNNGAIYSQQEIINRGILPKYSSSNDSREADKARGTDIYVRLSFVRNHPMLYTALTSGRISQPVVLEINPLIALMPNVLFSNQNALRRSATIGPSHFDLKQVHFEILKYGNYLNMSEENKSYYQAEILVPHRIGTEMILNLDEVKSML